MTILTLNRTALYNKIGVPARVASLRKGEAI